MAHPTATLLEHPVTSRLSWRFTPLDLRRKLTNRHRVNHGHASYRVTMPLVRDDFGRRRRTMTSYDDLLKHIISTYRAIRYGLAITGILFPLFLVSIGRIWYGVPIQDSMSSYYHATPDTSATTWTLRKSLSNSNSNLIKDLLFFLGQTEDETPMRSWFVGFLFVIGFVLIVYKGYDSKENIVLIIAGSSAIGVAIFPSGFDCSAGCRSFTLHAVFAAITFIGTAASIIVGSNKTLSLFTDQQQVAKYRFWYRLLAATMVASPIIIWVESGLFSRTGYEILVIESIGMIAFAAYWLVKNIEMTAHTNQNPKAYIA
jgi:hypothetical protein